MNSRTKTKTVDPGSASSSSGNEKTEPVNKIEPKIEEKHKQKQRRLGLEDVNPVGQGRRSRQLFDEVWRKFSGLGQISRTNLPDEFVIPEAQNTTVLVVGATSSIGRIVIGREDA